MRRGCAPTLAARQYGYGWRGGTSRGLERPPDVSEQLAPHLAAPDARLSQALTSGGSLGCATGHEARSGLKYRRAPRGRRRMRGWRGLPQPQAAAQWRAARCRARAPRPVRSGQVLSVLYARSVLVACTCLHAHTYMHGVSNQRSIDWSCDTIQCMQSKHKLHTARSWSC